MRGWFWEKLIAMAPEDSNATRTQNWVDELNGLRADFWENAEAPAQFGVNAATPRNGRCAASTRHWKPMASPAHIYSDAGTPTPHYDALPEAQGSAHAFCHTARLRWSWLGFARHRRCLVRRQGAPAIGMFGDGSFGMSVGELETLCAPAGARHSAAVQQRHLRLDQGSTSAERP